jgi:large subunit ribosomal protein L7/L12
MSEEAVKEAVELNDNQKKILDSIDTLTVVELASLVKALEEKYGVSAAPVAVAGAVAGGDAAAVEEKTSFDVFLDEFAPDKKIAAIKVVREITSLGLKEAKDLVEAAPKVVKEGASKEEADKIKADLEAAGAKASIK